LGNDYRPNPPFSALHKAEFKELIMTGELYALNRNQDCLDYGPWFVECDHPDSDTGIRLKKRFRATARKAAITAGAPARSNLLDWWVRRLARGQRRPYIYSLIQRSREYCEELESNALEARAHVEEVSGAPGLSRDRYHSDSVQYWLYSEPHCVLSDATQEVEFWEKYVWQGFDAAIDRIGTGPRSIRRWVDEAGKKYQKTKEYVRRIVAARIENKTGYLDACVEGLSYDLAVLRANYVIDRGYSGETAEQTLKLKAGN